MPLSGTNFSRRYPGNSSWTSVSALTIECWFYARSGLSTQQYLVHINKATGPAAFWTIFQITAANVLNFLCASGGGPASTTTLSAGRWYHLAVTWDGSATGGAKFFINGADGGLSDSSLAGTAGTAQDGTLSIGGRDSDSARVAVDCIIHKVRVYKRVLTPTEIANRYADPYTYDYVATYASDLMHRVDFDDSLDASTGATASSVGTSALTDRAPLDLPGCLVDLDAADAANTITAGRLATADDRSECGNDFTETSSAGPVKVVPADAIKLSLDHAVHELTTDYLSRAAGAGSTFNNQACTVLGWMAPQTNAMTSRQYLVSLGDPGSAGSGILEVAVTTGGVLNISRAGAGTETFSSDIPVQTTFPRFFAAACGTASRVLQVDSVQKTSGSAFTSGTATGGRVGCILGATTNNFVGDWYRLCVFGRQLSTAELTALYEWGKTPYLYTDATYLMVCEGSSTMAGYNLTKGEGLLGQLGATVPDWYIVNYANSGENRAHFNTGYAAQCGQAAQAFVSIPTANKVYFLQPFSNDWDGSTSLADIQTGAANNYLAIITAAQADFGVLWFLKPTVRTDYATDAEDEDREADALSFTTWINAYGTVIDRPADITPTDGTAASLQEITAGGYYAGDGIHLSNTGYRLYANGLQDVLDDFLNPTSTSPPPRIKDIQASKSTFFRDRALS